jgi:predicted phosphodiesterase
LISDSSKKLLIPVLVFFLLLTISLSGKDSSSVRLIFVSDTQNPLWIESLFLKTDGNVKATTAIFNSISSVNRPEAIIHLGDLTAIGMFNNQWRVVDKYLNKFKKSQIPFYPAFGNHDYFFIRYFAEKQFKKRFPFLKNSWYCVKIKDVAIIILNSNYFWLSREEIERQKKWYLEKLKALEMDKGVNAIIVGTHHPPFTNSKIVGFSTDVQDDFVPSFLESRKGKLFISGHAHVFEHFRNGGKDFLVIGGGGGLIHPLYKDEEKRFNDLSYRYTSKRMFHYLVITKTDFDLSASVIKLEKDFKTFNEVYKIVLRDE